MSISITIFTVSLADFSDVMARSWDQVCNVRRDTAEMMRSFQALRNSLANDLKSIEQLVPGFSVSLGEYTLEREPQLFEPLLYDEELCLMRILLKDEIKVPISVEDISKLYQMSEESFSSNLEDKICCTLEKLGCQNLIEFDLKQRRVLFINYFVLKDVYQYKEETADSCERAFVEPRRKRKLAEVFNDIPEKSSKQYVTYWKEKAQELINTKSFNERQHSDMARQIHDLVSMPSAKDLMNLEKFKCQERRIIEFCTYLTRSECEFNRRRFRSNQACSSKYPNQRFEICSKLHYRPVNNASTEWKLGDCSFLNTCFHMEVCKYVHYELDLNEHELPKFLEKDKKNISKGIPDKSILLYPRQWIQCDVRHFDMSCLGKFSVIMADPPWDIHMELPYGTMSDMEMVALPVPALQDEGFIFLWVTGRAMEVGRECLKAWGYTRSEDLIWVKINQLGKLIRTGRTGHWINHGKEHCLVGIKGNPKGHTACLDTDVLISEVRETSHKPDEIYGLLERLSPGTRKLELFGRMHNTRPNWITLGNQTDGVRLYDPEVIEAFNKIYPDGNALVRKTAKQV